MIITRLLQSVIVLSLLAIVLVLFNSAASSAHDTVFVDSIAPGPDKALAFDQPDVERIFYTGLNAPGKIDFYTFQGNAGLAFKAKILIPRTDPNSRFRPALALFGPGLPQPDTTELFSVPFNLPANNGLVTSIADKAQDDQTDNALYSKYDESYAQAKFWEGQTLLRQLPQSGTYYLVVFSPSNQTGKYALEVGDHDATGLKETLAFPVWWFGVHFWFGDTLTPTIVVLVILLLIAAIIFGRFFLKRRQIRRKLAKQKTVVAVVAQNEPTPVEKTETNNEVVATDEPAASLTPIAEPDLPLETHLEPTELTETAKIGEDKTYMKWRNGKLSGNLETDFLETQEENPKIKNSETSSK